MSRRRSFAGKEEVSIFVSDEYPQELRQELKIAFEKAAQNLGCIKFKVAETYA